MKLFIRIGWSFFLFGSLALAQTTGHQEEGSCVRFTLRAGSSDTVEKLICSNPIEVEATAGETSRRDTELFFDDVKIASNKKSRRSSPTSSDSQHSKKLFELLFGK